MVQQALPPGPYAPGSNVLDVIHRMRDRGLPDTIDLGTLSTIGVPEGNQPRTLAALKFLGLVTEDNRRSDLFDRLGRASSAEYPSMLAEILREAYAPVFQIVKPEEDSETAIFDAFRRYEPAGQRQRMVTLFIALCVEAGIISTEAAAQRQSAPRPRTNKPAPRGGRTPGRGEAAKPQQQPIVQQPGDGPDVRAIRAWIDQLPPEGYWTAAKRDRWFGALEGLVDYAIEVRAEEPRLASTYSQPDEDE